MDTSGIEFTLRQVTSNIVLEAILSLFQLDETALTLAPLSEGFVDSGLPTLTGWGAEKRLVRVVKQEGHGLGLSIQVSIP